MEMLDIKCEFHQIMKVVSKNPDIDVNVGQWTKEITFNDQTTA
jgi:hypothetical protein